MEVPTPEAVPHQADPHSPTHHVGILGRRTLVRIQTRGRRPRASRRHTKSRTRAARHQRLPRSGGRRAPGDRSGGSHGVVQPLRRRRPVVVNLEHAMRDEPGVEAVGDGVGPHRRAQQPDRGDLLVAHQGDDAPADSGHDRDAGPDDYRTATVPGTCRSRAGRNSRHETPLIRALGRSEAHLRIRRPCTPTLALRAARWGRRRGGHTPSREGRCSAAGKEANRDSASRRGAQRHPTYAAVTQRDVRPVKGQDLVRTPPRDRVYLDGCPADHDPSFRLG